MNFFCHEWTGSDGMLAGCRVDLMAENLEAWNVFARTGPQAGAADLKAAMEMSCVRDISDCWQRVAILKEEFGRK